MAVCGLRTILLIVCVLELIITIQRQVFDFLGYMWLSIIANFTNILLIIFGSFGAVQYITRYLVAYAIWSFLWLAWNVFLIFHFLNIGTLNKENDLLSMYTGSVSWWETNGWGCQPQWGEVEGLGTWRPAQVDGCFLQWDHVELAQSAVGALFATIALPLAILLAYKSFNKRKPKAEPQIVADKGTLSRRPVYTIELSPTETTSVENSLKPMTPRRVKRRSGSRGNNSSVRRSRRSYRNAAYMSSNASLPRDPRSSRPTSAHSSYSNFHAARPASYHTVERERSTPTETAYDQQPVSESVPIVTNRHTLTRHNSVKSAGYDVVGPYKEADSPSNEASNIPCGDLTARIDNIARDWGECHEGGWQEPPPPAPPYSSRSTPPPAPPYSGGNDPPPNHPSQQTYTAHSVHAQSQQYAPYSYLPAQHQHLNTPPPAHSHSHNAQLMHPHPQSPQYENHAAYEYHNRPYAHGTPVSPGPPAYQAINEIYTNMPQCQ